MNVNDILEGIRCHGARHQETTQVARTRSQQMYLSVQSRQCQWWYIFAKLIISPPTHPATFCKCTHWDRIHDDLVYCQKGRLYHYFYRRNPHKTTRAINKHKFTNMSNIKSGLDCIHFFLHPRFRKCCLFNINKLSRCRPNVTDNNALYYIFKCCIHVRPPRMIPRVSGWWWILWKVEWLIWYCRFAGCLHWI